MALSLLLFVLSPLASTASVLPAHKNDFRSALSDTWFHPPDHPIHALFRGQDQATFDIPTTGVVFCHPPTRMRINRIPSYFFLQLASTNSQHYQIRWSQLTHQRYHSSGKTTSATIAKGTSPTFLRQPYLLVVPSTQGIMIRPPLKSARQRTKPAEWRATSGMLRKVTWHWGSMMAHGW